MHLSPFYMRKFRIGDHSIERNITAVNKLFNGIII